MSQLSRPARFDAAGQIIREAGLDVHHPLVKHDVLVDDGKLFFDRFTPEAAAPGDAASSWQGPGRLSLASPVILAR